MFHLIISLQASVQQHHHTWRIVLIIINSGSLYIASHWLQNLDSWLQLDWTVGSCFSGIAFQKDTDLILGTPAGSCVSVYDSHLLFFFFKKNRIDVCICYLYTLHLIGTRYVPYWKYGWHQKNHTDNLASQSPSSSVLCLDSVNSNYSHNPLNTC